MSFGSCFWIAVGVVFYTYFGYPALLAFRARFRPAKAVRMEGGTPSVSLIIVAYNEEERIERKLANCRELDYPRDRLEVVVVSDGSTDRTEDLVTRQAAKGVRLVRLPGPRGKAAALNAVIPEARGDVLVFGDVRQDLEPNALRALVASFADPSVGAVSGELHFTSGPGSAGMEGMGLYWRYEKWIRRLESRVDSTVGVTGAIYALRRALYRPLDPRTILDDVAVPMNAVVHGYRVVFEAEARAYDRAPEDPRTEYRRKVRTLAGNYQLVALNPGLLHPMRNRLCWQLISHKILRLAVPWCLVVLLLTSAALTARQSGFHLAALVLQVGFYLTALVGGLRKRRDPGSRLLSVPYSFVLLNLAAAAALFVFVSGRATAAWKGPAR